VAYTSSLAIVELIAGARRSESEFKKRRAAVEAVFNAEVPVDWQFPEAKIACSFPQLRQTYDIFETRCASLQAIVAVLRSSRSVREFSRRAESLPIPEPIQFFEDSTFIMAETQQARRARRGNIVSSSTPERCRCNCSG
jgi:hypothetical protein